MSTPRRQFLLASASGLLLSQTTKAQSATSKPAQHANPISLHGVSPRLSIHLLDTYHGRAATGLQVDFLRLVGEQSELLAQVTVNQFGRSDEPLLLDESYQVGEYELLLHLHTYYQSHGAKLPNPPFLSEVPIRFRIQNIAERLHLPVQFSPWNYTYYRGS